MDQQACSTEASPPVHTGNAGSSGVVWFDFLNDSAYLDPETYAEDYTRINAILRRVAPQFLNQLSRNNGLAQQATPVDSASSSPDKQTQRPYFASHAPPMTPLTMDKLRSQVRHETGDWHIVPLSTNAKRAWLFFTAVIVREEEDAIILQPVESYSSPYIAILVNECGNMWLLDDVDFQFADDRVWNRGTLMEVYINNNGVNSVVITPMDALCFAGFSTVDNATSWPLRRDAMQRITSGVAIAMVPRMGVIAIDVQWQSCPSISLGELKHGWAQQQGIDCVFLKHKDIQPLMAARPPPSSTQLLPQTWSQKTLLLGPIYTRAGDDHSHVTVDDVVHEIGAILRFKYT